MKTDQTDEIDQSHQRNEMNQTNQVNQSNQTELRFAKGYRVYGSPGLPCTFVTVMGYVFYGKWEEAK